MTKGEALKFRESKAALREILRLAKQIERKLGDLVDVGYEFYSAAVDTRIRVENAFDEMKKLEERE